jgi:hypothetical protein
MNLQAHLREQGKWKDERRSSISGRDQWWKEQPFDGLSGQNTFNVLAGDLTRSE